MIDTSNILTEALVQALEQMAFLTVMPPEDEQSVPERSFFAEMTFSGPTDGTIQLAAGVDFCREIAQNICGTEQVDDTAAADSIKELLNVTSGLLLPMLESELTDAFDVTVPQARSFETAAQWREFVGQETVSVLNIEGSPLATRLIIQGPKAD